MLPNNNPSGLWKTLNELTSRGTHSVVSEDVDHKTSKTIASLFNNFFTNIGISLANAIKQKCASKTFYSDQPPQVNPTSKFKEIEVLSVQKQLSALKINKSTGLDRISARLLKDAAVIIAPTLTDIFNQSLKSSTFPKIFKEG